jgi:hypothetical protein
MVMTVVLIGESWGQVMLLPLASTMHTDVSIVYIYHT